MVQLLERPKPPARPAAKASEPRVGVAPEERVGVIGGQEKKREFRAHLAVYVTVNGLLWLVWAVVLPLGGPWFPWPLLSLLSLVLLVGWGLGLAVHARDAYGPKPFGVETFDRKRSRSRRLAAIERR